MNREAHAALLVKARAVHVCLFQSIAVTFGTATSSSIDVGFNYSEIRSSLSTKVTRKSSLPAQTQTINHLVVAFYIGAL